MTDTAEEGAFFKKMITVSLALHVSLILIFSLKAVFFPSENLDIDSAIRVDMVDLPDKIAALPPKAPDAAPPAKIKEEAPPRPLVEKKSEPAILKDALKKIDKFKEQDQRKKAIEEIEKQVQQEEAEKARAERLAKIKAAIVKGNHISPGSALQGLNKAAFNDYTSTLKTQIHDHWNLPQWLRGANLHAVVRIYIDHRGILIKRVIQQSSGDQTFDDYALKTIDEAQPFPPPPEKFVDLVQLDGIGLNMQP